MAAHVKWIVEDPIVEADQLMQMRTIQMMLAEPAYTDMFEETQVEADDPRASNTIVSDESDQIAADQIASDQHESLA